MTTKNTAFRETAPVFLGQLLCTAVMISIFALAGKFQLSVLLGGLVGGFLGGKLYGKISTKLLKWLFAAFLFYAGVKYLL